MSFFEVKDLSVGYGGRNILSRVSFSLGENRILGLLGENGSGKTTLLKALCGILPYSGECLLRGAGLHRGKKKERAQSFSYVPQKSGLTVDISVLDAVLMGKNKELGLLQFPDEPMKRQAHEMIGLVGLKGKADSDYRTLSEGQKQLCILARALVSEPELLFLDEPESALDFRARYRTLDIVRSWADGGSRAAVIALHDPQLALNCCDDLLLLKNGAASEVIRIRETPREKMEEELQRLYSSLSVAECCGRSGKKQFVVLREEETE